MIPTNEKAPGACYTKGPEDTNNATDSAIEQRLGQVVSTLKAQFALHGHVVRDLKGGRFLVCKYGFTFLAVDVDSLRAFARKVGVSK